MIDLVIDGVLLLLPVLLIHGNRLLARLFVGVGLVTAYETLSVARSGATIGKHIAGTKVVELDVGRLDLGEACKRGLLVAISSIVVGLAPLVLIGSLADQSASSRGGEITAGLVFVVLAVGIVVSVFASSLRRSFIDRMCGTVVVSRDTPDLVTVASLAPYAAVQQPPEPTRWGPLARLDQRRRARAARLDNAPMLVLALVAVVFATSVPHLAAIVTAALAAGWEVLFVLDETWRVSRYGGTSGHLRLGLAVVDVDTGEAPDPLNALVRALLVSLPMYVLPLTAIVGIVLLHRHPLMILPITISGALTVGFLVWLRVSPGRGVHDLAAHTMVVSPPRLRARAVED